MASGAIACRFRAVSTRISPLVTEEVEAEILMASADNRFAAISNDVRVRVEDFEEEVDDGPASKGGTFLMARADTSLKVSAVSRMSVISSAESSLIPRRSFLLNVKSKSIVPGRWGRT